jgi:hypothetical protein
MQKTLLALGVLLAVTSTPATAREESDQVVRQAIIRQSIAEYPGNCPCPYNSARNGSRCGGRSAYNRAGGYAPKCYPSDVSDAEVRAWRARRR